ncbi:heterokaryon incompatibility protein-domain-containing protein [Suillus spraguei]|nr:heterokaryon incompatibility protein-domain-containing protein [Suillus spraguei]
MDNYKSTDIRTEYPQQEWPAPTPAPRDPISLTPIQRPGYDRVIDNSQSDAVFENHSKVKYGERSWMDALLEAQKIIKLNPSSHIGYKLKHAAFHGAQRYDEAIAAFQTMLSILDNACDAESQKLRQQYLSPSEVDRTIQKVISVQLENAPLRVLDTTTGLLCNRETQIHTFKSSTEYSELVSSTITHRDIDMKRIEGVVGTYFRYAMLSHRWEGKEPLLQDIQGKVVYKLDPVGSITKLQSFCKTARDLGYRWAWSDTCCIDKNNHVELQESVNSMFIWYHHSDITVVYLSDVPPSSKSGALAKSAWNTRGWTVQEFLAPKVILFYQKDWTPYLNDRTPNHKDSVAIMQELENVTGIDRRAIVAFRPEMKNAREKLQWASRRTTTLQEDIAYSLSGLFGIRLNVDYGEKKQSALGRLLREIIAQSGDITALDWVGKSSDFNSCLPADITSYTAPPCKLTNEIQLSVSSLRGLVPLQSASKLYQALDHLSAPHFAYRMLHLPCIVFPVTEAIGRPGRDQDTYTVKSNGLLDLQITMEDTLIPFSPTRPPPVWQKILLVRPWSRDLLELDDAAEDSSAAHNEPDYSDSYSRALRLIVRLGQPFAAFLLARQRDGAFKRIASGHDIVARVKDVTSIDNMMDVRILQIL